ncbi:tRNA (adenosine(37)-N6)-dimethylallyltransferase MiaA [bacterium CG10_46_32]|nr:MAG: tRNA (adenosine(37)-N6)-dimethylallyltransferase MiaA [bacterium CG10_46_32]PIR55694.1 MAG: tRNA (adenosine(37)-N6)-dimethylallyltransferase MiaA [Parcubacteria group bacterium CG10_big_fil_rev_8_21_14_0_10_46_32]
MNQPLPKLIAILGPTASGKSSLAIELAQKFNGEIVSADSRQVYTGLDIGTGKVTKDEQHAVPHHLLDSAEPGDNFNVADFQKRACEAIDDIVHRDKRPLFVGGSALYAYAVIDNYKLTDVPPNPKLRKELEENSIDELVVIASERIRERSNLNSETKPTADDKIASVASLLRNDIKNKRRLIRAIEKLESGAPLTAEKLPPRYNTLILGKDVPREELYKKIDTRVDERIRDGMIEEVKQLRDKGLNDVWLISLGLEYKWITEYLQGTWTQEEMVKRLKGAIHAFARRQMTWFNRDKRIVWVADAKKSENMIHKFLE